MFKPQWDGQGSSLHFMKQAFSKVFEAANNVKPVPEHAKQLQELLQQSILEIANVIDARFDSLSLNQDKLEAKLEKA